MLGKGQRGLGNLKGTPIKALLGALLGLSLLVTPACGKKSPPFLPVRGLPLKVEGLAAEKKDGEVILRGRLQAVGAGAPNLKDISGYRIAYGHYPFGNEPCEGCPIDLPVKKEFRDQGFVTEDFSCRLPEIQESGIYYFEVTLIGAKAAWGPSGRAKLVMKE